MFRASGATFTPKSSGDNVAAGLYSVKFKARDQESFFMGLWLVIRTE